jgi:zinc/manganese transport system substrate-binding protein
MRFLCLIAVLWSLALPGQAAINIFACEPEWAALSRELSGDLATVFQATSAGQDPHRIEARPSLIARLRRADLLVCSGADLEVGWLPLLQRQAANSRVLDPRLGYFEAAAQVKRLEVHQSVDRSMGHVHGAGNPHVHLDPYRLLTIAGKLSQRLQKVDPGNAATYRQNYLRFEKAWESAINRWEQQASRLKGARVLTQHKSWTYLIDWLGLSAVADLEPKPGLPPTAGHLARVVKIAREQKPFATLVAAYQSRRSADWLQEKTGVKALHLAYTVGGAEATDTLIALYDSMLQELLEAAR